MVIRRDRVILRMGSLLALRRLSAPAHVRCRPGLRQMVNGRSTRFEEISELTADTCGQKPGNVTLVKNHNAAVNHRPTTVVKRRPPTTGSAQPGNRDDRNESIFVVKAP